MHRIDEQQVKLKEWIEEGVKDLRVTGLSGSARAYCLAGLLLEMERPCLIVLPTAKEAKKFLRELEFFLPRGWMSGDVGERRLYSFPIYDISPLKGLSPHREIVSQRLEALYALASEKAPVVVTSVEAVLFRILPKKEMMTSVDLLQVDEEVDREKLLRRLDAAGFQRTSLVEERGDYSVRGGVIDLFPPLYASPLRVEFFGDKVESLRFFDPLSQRSLQTLKEAIVLPANEIIMREANVQRARSMGRLPVLMKEVGAFPGQEAWLNHFYEHPDTVFDYVPDRGLLVLEDDLQVEKEIQSFIEGFVREEKKLRLESEQRESPLPEIEGVLLSPEELRQRFTSFQNIRFGELPLSAEEGARALHYTGLFRVEEDFTLKLSGKGRASMAPLAEKVTQWLNMGFRIVLVCRTEQQANRLRDILHNYQVSAERVVSHWNEVPSGKGLTICLGRLSQGFSWPEIGLQVVSEDEIFGPKRSLTKSKPGMGEVDWTSFSQLKAGDLVVHEDHGIGRYGGLSKMEIDQKVNDFVVIEYAGNDRLYIPADRISILQKYIGADEMEPKLDQLGGRSWDVVKEKTKKSVREIAKQLVEIYALRKYRQGFAFSRPDNTFMEFEAGFEHEETPDQVKAIGDVLSDMESDRPMDRLICGDVGFGKTEVAIRASFKAVMDGKQVAVLVPTTVLAEQHFETFSKRMKSYPVTVAVLSRFKTRAEQKEILARVRSGKVDVLIGTHRMLQKDVSFRDLGLLIIDEEQRFGVKQKEAIKGFRALVDVLALTATPIPRTLHMTLMGIRDLSIIETPPEDRQPIQTFLSPYDESAIAQGIQLEVQRGGQVFFVHNRVQTIHAVANRLMKLVPHARLAVAHGQMKERDLEETMIRFLKKEIDVLVCTTIIEAGLDIPSVNTIFINEVDRFGLAQIYQLRGRVGRSDENAYAHLLLSKEATLTRDAEKRLRALMDFSHLGAGIQLAMHDLKIRGGGNILGFSQSGHISAIGYELYVRMIEQAISELKGEEWHEEVNPEINVNMPAYLPSRYVADADVRLNLYRRLSGLREDEELASIKEEMLDRFGPFPAEVINLLEVMSVRLLLKKLRITRLDVVPDGLIITFSEDTAVKPAKVISLVKMQPKKFRFLTDKKLKVRLPACQPLEALLESKKIIHTLASP
jgi:transcription-repair coupling factor (superfamily II helicase)